MSETILANETISITGITFRFPFRKLFLVWEFFLNIEFRKSFDISASRYFHQIKPGSF